MHNNLSASLLDYPYTSQRMPLLAANVVSTSQPLAASAGLQMFARGGSIAQLSDPEVLRSASRVSRCVSLYSGAKVATTE